MAVAKLKKIEILGHNSQRDEVLEFLQQQGQVEVVDLKDKSDEYGELSFRQQSIRHEEVSEAVEKLSWLMSFFEGVSGTKRSPLAPKPVFRRKELFDLLRNFDYASLHTNCREIESHIKNIEKKKLDHGGRKKELLPWVRLDVPLNRIGETRFTTSVLGSVGEKAFPALKESLESVPDVHLEVVDEDKTTTYLFIAYLKAVEEQVAELLKEHDVSLHHLPRHPALVEEVLKHIAADEKKLESERESLLDKARSLLPEETKLAALLDYFSNVETKEGTKGRLLYSRDTFFLQGWIKESDGPVAERKLERDFDTVDVYVSDPAPDDVVPIVLENKNIVRPFEFLTRMYGYPGYSDVDPTPFLAPFFFVFFGFCLGDAGYGLLLLLVSVFALKKFKMGWQGTRFFRLMLWCSISTMVVGVLTSGWLGDLPNYLFGVSVPALWVNPLENPTAVLSVALKLGIMQIWTGYAVAAYDNIRRRQYLAVLLDQAPIFLLLAGLTGAGLIFLKGQPGGAFKPYLILIAIGSIVILAAGGRSQPSIGGKIGFGALGLYGAASGYLSDILSYSRLWALGLVTTAMASTVNLMAATIGKLIPIVGILFTVAILVGGHVATFLINMLGAFIHPTRLQFVEFFSKFFKGTGRPFEPFSIQNRFTLVEE